MGAPFDHFPGGTFLLSGAWVQSWCWEGSQMGLVSWAFSLVLFLGGCFDVVSVLFWLTYPPPTAFAFLAFLILHQPSAFLHASSVSWRILQCNLCSEIF